MALAAFGRADPRNPWPRLDEVQSATGGGCGRAPFAGAPVLAELIRHEYCLASMCWRDAEEVSAYWRLEPLTFVA